MQIEFQNKVVLITGGTAGIGLACARLFGQLGARVAICGTGSAKLEKALESLRAEGITAFGETCDVGNSAQLMDFADHSEAALGKLDVLLCNASLYPQYSIIDTPEEIWDSLLEVNLKSVYLCGRIAREKMGGNGGVVLIASSFSAVLPSVGSGAYAATKSAANSMIRTLAAELAPYSIRVCGYLPGVIQTDMTRPLTDKNGDEMKRVIALQKFGEDIDVAWAAAFLASDYARYITGTTLEISGGKLGVQNPAKAWSDKANR